MATHGYKTGSRTRNVVNIASPGDTGAAYELTAANSAPTASTDGFYNFNMQKTLHVLVHNNGLTDGSAGAIGVSAIAIWGYNSSLGGKWTLLRRVDRANSADTLVYPAYDNLSVAQDTTLRLTIPIDGVERIAVRAETFSGVRDTGTLDVYLGVNSI